MARTLSDEDLTYKRTDGRPANCCEWNVRAVRICDWERHCHFCWAGCDSTRQPRGDFGSHRGNKPTLSFGRGQVPFGSVALPARVRCLSTEWPPDDSHPQSVRSSSDSVATDATLTADPSTTMAPTVALRNTRSHLAHLLFPQSADRQIPHVGLRSPDRHRARPAGPLSQRRRYRHRKRNDNSRRRFHHHARRLLHHIRSWRPPARQSRSGYAPA
jgi:hypothetical protein